MKILLILAIPVLFTTCVSNTYEIRHSSLLEDWEYKMISKGDNFPNFQTTKDSIHLIVVLLHEGFKLSEIREHFNWQREEFDQKIKILLDAEFIKPIKNKNYNPNIAVFSNEEGEKIRTAIDPIVTQTVDSIRSKIDSIKSRTKQISCLKSFDFQSISLFILSNVLLDNWQIENVEGEYLRAKRPNRHGKTYYAAYLGKPNGSTKESFGIYGNQIERIDSFAIARYGNLRYTPEVIIKKEELILAYSKRSNNSDFNYPQINNECYAELSDLANYFKPALLDILLKNDKMMRNLYFNSKHSRETSYEEYFMWLYHILYSDITDELIRENLIILPKEKVSFYSYK